MARQYLRTWEVTWRGEFPVDMLRYDCCYPLGPEDAAAITRSIQEPNNEQWTAQVQNGSRLKLSGPPTVKRWASFGCRVSDVRVT